MPNIPILILASGAGKRFQGVKQLQDIEGVPMIRRVIHTAMRTRGGEVIVILGAHLQEIEPAISDMPITTIINENWQEGMAESIKSGVQYVQKKLPKVKAVMIALGDQPFIDVSDFNRLVACFIENPDNIVCAQYNGLRGVPAIFPMEFWNDLMHLSGDSGAKDLLRSSNGTLTIDIPEAGRDIDLQSDLE